MASSQHWDQGNDERSAVAADMLALTPRPSIVDNRATTRSVNTSTMTVSNAIYRQHESSATGADERRRRRQLIVSLMEPEPTLVDYLVQNGVVARPDADHLATETDRRRQNERLLAAIESLRKQTDATGTGGDTSDGGLRLLTNALRQTGQHYLANMIDDSARIPGYRASGYLSRARHKGQVGVIIRVRSVRLPVMCAWRTAVVDLLGGVDQVGLDELHAAIWSLERTARQSASELVVKAIDEEKPFQTKSMTTPRLRADYDVDSDKCQRSNAYSVVPPAPPPTPLCRLSPSSPTTTATVTRDRNFIRCLFFCWCCRSSRPTPKEKFTDEVPVTGKTRLPSIESYEEQNECHEFPPPNGKAMSGIRLCQPSNNDIGSSGGTSRPSVLPLSNSFTPSRVPSLADDHSTKGVMPTKMVVVSELCSSHENGNCGLQELSEKDDEGNKRTEGCDVRSVDCKDDVKQAVDYVRHRIVQMYDSLVVTTTNSTTKQGHSCLERNQQHDGSAMVDKEQRTKLVVYFEQHRGILVLDVNRFLCDDDTDPDTAGVEVMCICTRMDQIDRLRRDLISGKLAKDLSDTLGRRCDDSTLHAGDDNGDPEDAQVIFEVMIDVGELDIAQADLT